MNKKILFIDESGKTGTQRFSGEWNFTKQPYFALCGILVFEKDLDVINNFIEEIRTEYKIQGEIKSTKKVVCKNSEDIILKVWNKLNEINCELFIEVVNKKFCMAMTITNYCVFPYYDIPIEIYNSDAAILMRKNIANYIYESISNKLLGNFVEFFDNNTQDVTELVHLCNELHEEIESDEIKEFINETIDSINSYEKLGVLQHNVFPLVDYYKGKISTVAVCPHIDSFNNILNRLINLNDLSIIHDKIVDLDEALLQTLNERYSEDVPNIMSFEDSKQFNMLQISDFFCGTVNNSIQNILQGKKEKNPIINEIIQKRVNFVSTFTEQELVFPNNTSLQKSNFFKKIF